MIHMLCLSLILSLWGAVCARADFIEDLVSGGVAVGMPAAVLAHRLPVASLRKATTAEALRMATSSKMRTAAQYCLGRDISKLSCDTMPATDSDSRAGNFAEQLGYKVFHFSMSDSSDLLLGAGWMIANRVAAERSGLDAQIDQARQEMGPIAKSFSQRVRELGLDTCHSACLVQCFTSQALTYDDPASENVIDFLAEPADRSPYAAAGTGTGICRNYADLAEELNKKMGGAGRLRPVLMRSLEHVMVGYRDNGDTYLLEPQSNPFVTGHCGRYAW